MIGSFTPGELAIGEAGGGDDAIVSVPSLTATVTLGVNIKLNTIIYVPAVTAVATLTVPIIRHGLRIDVPSLVSSVLMNAPVVSAGVRVSVPSLFAGTTIIPPVQRSGLSIVVSNTVTMVTNYGEIGNGAFGEFAIGEGPQGTRDASINLKAHVSLSAPKILSGVSIGVPSLIASALLMASQVHARYRPIRVWTIAS